MTAGRRLRALHHGFRGVRKDGERYSALEPDAYAWVHATLIAGFVDGHAHFGRPMSGEQLERFYREYRGLGRLIGVRERDLPNDWAGFAPTSTASSRASSSVTRRPIVFCARSGTRPPRRCLCPAWCGAPRESRRHR